MDHGFGIFVAGLRSSIGVLGQVAVRSSGEERSLSLPGTPRCQGAAKMLPIYPLVN